MQTIAAAYTVMLASTFWNKTTTTGNLGQSPTRDRPIPYVRLGKFWSWLLMRQSVGYVVKCPFFQNSSTNRAEIWSQFITACVIATSCCIKSVKSMGRPKF